MKSSPFVVDQAAEAERLAEVRALWRTPGASSFTLPRLQENRIRLAREARERKEREQRLQQVKNDIVLKVRAGSCAAG